MKALGRGLAVALAALLVAGVALALRPDGPAGRRGAPQEVRLATPVLSVRRAAGALVALRAQRRLTTAVERVLAEPANAPWVAQGCVVVEVGDRTLVARAPDRGVIPASAMKVLTAAAALDLLGPETRLTTALKADAPPSGGVVAGDLQVLGGGDPIIETDAAVARPGRRQPVVRTRMEDLAQAVVDAGVRQVTGGVRADEGRYDRQRVRPGWKPGYLADGEVAPLSALLVDDGQGPDGEAVAQPALRFAQVLTDLLRARGVQVAGAPSVGEATGRATVHERPSLPVRDLVAQMVRESDNTTAELLVKEVGVRASGTGTTEAGLAAAREALARRGLDVAGLAARDGSGLDRGDRATCRVLIEALQGAGRTSELADSLPVAARSGTLLRRFVGTPVAGRLRAKTGSLDGVSSLVGWVDPARAGPPPVAFAVVSNGIPTSLPATRLADQLGVALGSWPDAPAADAVAPLPPTEGPAGARP